MTAPAFRPRIHSGRHRRPRLRLPNQRQPGAFYGCPGCVIDEHGRAPIGYCGADCLRRRTGGA